MEHEKYSYVEALRWLAQKYDIAIEETATSPEFKAQQLTADSLFIVNQFARDFFSNALLETDEGKAIALSYLKQRGFNEEIIRKFQLGYNPEQRDAFAQAAITAQYNTGLLQKAGLITFRDEQPADNYRGRIIFPIHNQSGKVLGFGARVIKSNDKAPKYINTPENEIYVKSKILYGTYFARHAIDKADECLLVEGYTDVVSLHQAGIENVVASGGTSLTTDQLRLIKKYSTHLTIIYDGDAAGIKAAMRGLDLALEEGLDVRMVLIPDKEDPDSYVNKIGAEAFKAFIQAEKKDFILFQLGIALQEASDDNAKKAVVVNQIAETLSKINKTEEFSKRQDYVRQVSGLLKIEEAGFNELVNKFIREKFTKEESRNIRQTLSPTEPIDEAGTDQLEALLQKDEMQEQAFVRTLIEFGTKSWKENETVADFVFKEMADADLEELIDNRQLVDIILLYRNWYNEGLMPGSKNFLYHDDHAMSSLVIKIMDTQTEISHNWKNHFEGKIATREELYREEVTSTLNYLRLRKIKRLIIENQLELEKTNNSDDQLLYMETHMALKALETKLTSESGMVIYK